jgi:aspartyl-tRNA(Asn)/glutamyl-tRNA(Gln) amidotransferase subunit A
VLGAIAGADPRDPTSRTRPLPGPADPSRPNLRVGLVQSPLDEDIRTEVRAAVDEAATRLADRGAEITTVVLSSFDRMSLVSPALGTEAHDLLLPLALDGPSAFANPEIRYRVLAAEFVRAADVRRARAVALSIRAEILRALEDVDVLLLPTTTTPAFEIDATHALVGDGDQVDLTRPGGQARLATRLTQPFNIAGTPAVSIPSPSPVDGLPVGVQLVGRPWADDALLDVAAMAEADGAAYRPSPVQVESGQ